MPPALIEFAGGAIGAGRPRLVVAEAGVNHNGDLGLAVRPGDAPAAAGADAVKVQTSVTAQLVPRRACLARYQR